MAIKREAMKIEQIRLAEKFLFGIERVSIFLFVFFGGVPRFLYYSVGLFLFSNAYYASLAYERLFVTPRANESKSILFLVERYAIWFAGSYFFMEFPVYRFLAAVIFVMSNMYLVTKLCGINMTQMILNYVTPAGDEKENEKEKEKVKQIAPSPEQKVQHNEKKEKTENHVDQPEVHSDMEAESSTLIKVNIMEEDIVSNKEPQQHEEEKEQRDEEERRDGEQDEEDEDEDFDLNVNIDSGSDDFNVDDNDDDEVSDISDDGQGGMRANDDSNGETMPEDGEKNVEIDSKWEMEDSAAEISEADAITKEMKPSLNDSETQSRNRIEERNMLITKIDELCRESEKYLEEKIHEWEEVRAFLETEYQEQKKELEDKYVELKEENIILRAKLRAESTIIQQLNQTVLKQGEKCRRLEEENAVLNERLDIEKAAAEFFKKCMHDLGLN